MSSTHFFIIVNYNAGADLITCVRSILASRAVTPQIVIVDNASTDTSLRDCQKSFPHLHYIRNTHNSGFGAAANRGMRHALHSGAQTLTLCNPDAVIDPNCMHRIYTAMREHSVHIASPVIYRDADHTDVWFAGGTLHWWRMRAVHTPHTSLPDVPVCTDTDYITGCVMTIDRLVCEKIGLFDERFFLYYEDADISVRAQKSGFTLGVVTNAHAVHAEVSENTPAHKTYFLVLSGLIFFRKHTRGIRTIYFYLHFALRRLKNFCDRLRKKPLSSTVNNAFRDYVCQNR